MKLVDSLSLLGLAGAAAQKTDAATKNFVCFLHRPGVITPEMRLIACPDVPDLPGAISDELPFWPRFDVLEVCDEEGEALFRIDPSQMSPRQ